MPASALCCGCLPAGIWCIIRPWRTEISIHLKPQRTLQSHETNAICPFPLDLAIYNSTSILGIFLYCRLLALFEIKRKKAMLEEISTILFLVLDEWKIKNLKQRKMQWRNENNDFNWKAWKIWIEPTTIKTKKKTRTRNNFREFSYHIPLLPAGSSRAVGTGFVFFINLIFCLLFQQNEYFLSYFSLCRILYLLLEKNWCLQVSHRKAALYMCQRYGKDRIYSPNFTIISYSFIAHTQVDLYCLTLWYQEWKHIIQVQGSLPT